MGAEKMKSTKKRANNKNEALSSTMTQQFNSLNQLLMEQSQQTQATLKKIIEKGDKQTHLLQEHANLLQNTCEPP